MDVLTRHGCQGLQSNDVAHGNYAVQHGKDDLEFLAKAPSAFRVCGKELTDLLLDIASDIGAKALRGRGISDQRAHKR